METETEQNPTPANEEIQHSIPQPNEEIVTSEAKEETGQKEPTEKRKREEEKEHDNPPKLEANSGRNSLWKTTLCSYFRRDPAGVCKHGDTCRFAHGEAELRLRPDNSWDPTSDRAKKLQKTNGSESDNKRADEEQEGEDPMGEEVDDDTTLDKCLIGLSRNWASDSLKSFLDDQGILYKEAKKKKKMAVGFVVFENVEQVKHAIKVLSEKSASGKQIKVANASRRSLDKKHMFNTTESKSGDVDRNEESDAAETTSVTQGLVPKAKNARDVVTPLAHMPYNDQLEHKKSSLLQILKRLTRNARKACPDAVPLPEWILKSKEIGGLPCKLEGILESPVIEGYRNKCEFSVGYSLQGKQTVGFMMGNFREGVVAVEEPLNCPNVSKISCKYALIFQDFLQSSVFPVWNRINNTGFWRQFTVREGRNPSQVSENQETSIAEVMLIVQVCSVDVDEEQMKTEFKRMAQALALGAASSTPQLPLTTIVVQDHKGISNAAPADCPLLSLPIPKVEGHSFPDRSGDAEARIHDYISNLRFSISPTAFFQVNTLAAEKLYSLAGDWAELSQDTLLFDVCCGTGTIGLTLAHRVGMVIGIEMNESAVSDAQRNAQLNGITNCKFVWGKAEDVMGTLLTEYLVAPQQDSGNKDKDVNARVRNENEKLVPDAAASADNVACQASPEGAVLPSNGSKPLESFQIMDADSRIDSNEENSRNEVVLNAESKIDSNKENGRNEPLAIESSNNETNGTKSSTVYLEKCSIESGATCKENDELRNETQDNLKAIDSNTENLESKKIEEEKVEATVRQFKNIVAIVDPPRVGLHPIVIKALRTHSGMRRLVYISCNPDSLVANAIELCTPSPDKLEKAKGHRGWRSMSSAGLARHRTKSMPISEHFWPVKAMAVDLFPHTPHCELVMLLER